MAEGPLPPTKGIDSSIPDSAPEAGIGANTGTDNGPDTGTVESDGSQDGASSPDYSCQHAETRRTDLVYARQLGDQIKLVGMGENTLLAEKSADGITEPVVVFLDPDTKKQRGQAMLGQRPTSSLRSIGVVNQPAASTGEQWPFDYYAIVLMTGQSGNALYGAGLSIGQVSDLVLVEHTQLPTDVELRGLLYLADKMVGIDENVRSESRFHKLCAFGDGLYCLSFDGGSWQIETKIESGLGYQFNSMALVQRAQQWFIVAAGEQGMIVQVPLDTTEAPWELNSGVNGNLITVSISGERIVSSGDNGVIVYIEGPLDKPVICSVSDKSIVSLKLGGDRLRGTTSDGALFAIPFGGSEACFYGVNLGSALFSRLIGFEGAFLVLNEDALILVSADVEPVTLN